MSALSIGIILVILAVVIAYLAIRAGGARLVVARWAGMVLGGLVALLLLVVGGVDLLGVYRLEAPRDIPARPLSVSSGSEQLARGEHLAHLCASCHSTSGNLPLNGSRVSLIGAPDGSGLGDLYPPNLTPAGPIKDWSDDQVIRAIRDGVDANGHALIIMPSEGFHAMSDADVTAVVAYLRSQPPVVHATPPRRINLIGTLLIGAGLFPTSVQAPIAGPVTASPVGPTAAYGQYLVAISGCRSCHGDGLTGGRPGQGPPPGPNLTVIIPRWTSAQFVQTIRTGTDPNHYHLNASMPWEQFSAAYSDDELTAIYEYLRTLAPKSG